ncbi:MAG: formylglycine-generating enzyme family protein [Pirellulales bacterium]
MLLRSLRVIIDSSSYPKQHDAAESPTAKQFGRRFYFAVSLAIAILLPISSSVGDEPPAKTSTNTIGMRLTYIPSGEFVMGSSESVADRQRDFPQYETERLDLADERPAHKVRITRGFYFGTFEVTRGEFRKFVEQSGRTSEAESDGTGGYGYEPNRPTTGDAFAGRDTRYSWRDAGFPQTDEHPVINVTWSDAVAMAEWLSKREGKTYRLPTEAEWEYACRAGTNTRYSIGDDPKKLADAAVFYDADTVTLFPQWKPFALAEHDGFLFTAPVGSKHPNAFGLYDMHGSVWEWCSDWYAEDAYARSASEDPRGPSEGSERVRRGGSWHSWSYYCRSSFRNYNTPESRYPLLGFRLVMETESNSGPK